MSKRSDEQLVPKNGHSVVVLIVCRISGCSRQKEASNDDQQDNAKEALARLYEGPVHFDVISTKGKGERLDRPEIEQIEAAYRSGKYDLVIFDDLSRLIRGGAAAKLLGIGVDHGTRTLCVQDGIDTTESTWEEDALNACSESVSAPRAHFSADQTEGDESLREARLHGEPSDLWVSGCGRCEVI